MPVQVLGRHMHRPGCHTCIASTVSRVRPASAAPSAVLRCTAHCSPHLPRTRCCSAGCGATCCSSDIPSAGLRGSGGGPTGRGPHASGTGAGTSTSRRRGTVCRGGQPKPAGQQGLAYCAQLRREGRWSWRRRRSGDTARPAPPALGTRPPAGPALLAHAGGCRCNGGGARDAPKAAPQQGSLSSGRGRPEPSCALPHFGPTWPHRAHPTVYQRGRLGGWSGCRRASA